MLTTLVLLLGLATVSLLIMQATTTPGALSASGITEADDVVMAFETGGRLTAVPIGLGEQVRMGTVLAQLDDTLIRLQIRQADAAGRQQLEAQADRLTLRSPINGVVTRLAGRAGEIAAAGQPIVIVADLSRLHAIVYVREAELGQVGIGQVANVTADPWPGRTFRGVVTSVNQRAEYTPRNVQTRRDRLNLMFGVRLRIDNADGTLKPGLPVDAEFPAAPVVR